MVAMNLAVAKKPERRGRSAEPDTALPQPLIDESKPYELRFGKSSSNGELPNIRIVQPKTREEITSDATLNFGKKVKVRVPIESPVSEEIPIVHDLEENIEEFRTKAEVDEEFDKLDAELDRTHGTVELLAAEIIEESVELTDDDLEEVDPISGLTLQEKLKLDKTGEPTSSKYYPPGDINLDHDEQREIKNDLSAFERLYGIRTEKPEIAALNTQSIRAPTRAKIAPLTDAEADEILRPLTEERRIPEVSLSKGTKIALRVLYGEVAAALVLAISVLFMPVRNITENVYENQSGQEYVENKKITTRTSEANAPDSNTITTPTNTTSNTQITQAEANMSRALNAVNAAIASIHASTDILTRPQLHGEVLSVERAYAPITQASAPVPQTQSRVEFNGTTVAPTQVRFRSENVREAIRGRLIDNPQIEGPIQHLTRTGVLMNRAIFGESIQGIARRYGLAVEPGQDITVTYLRVHERLGSYEHLLAHGTIDIDGVQTPLNAVPTSVPQYITRFLHDAQENPQIGEQLTRDTELLESTFLQYVRTR